MQQFGKEGSHLNSMPGNFCCALIGRFRVAFCSHVKMTPCAKPFMTENIPPTT